MLIAQGLIFAIIFGVVAAVSLPSAFAYAHEDAIPVTAVAQLAPGSVEKVFGTVSPNQSSVIVVFDYTDSQGQSVTGRHVESFWFNDSTGRALVEMGANSSSSPTIATGGEPYPAVGTPTGFQYESGDRIAILGKVVAQGNVTILQAQAVGGSPTTLVHSSLAFDAAFFGVPLAVCAIAIAAGFALTSSRLNVHNRNLPSWKLKRPKQLHAPPSSDDVRWSDNSVIAGLRRTGLVLIGVSIGLAALWVVVVLSPIPFSDPVYTSVLVGAPLALLFTLVFGGSDSWYARHGLRRVGLGTAGLYLDYRYPPKGARSYLAWSDIRELEAPMAISRRSMKADTALGSEYVHYLDPDLMRLIRECFEAARVPYRDQRAPLRPSVASLTGSGPPASVAEIHWQVNPLRARWMHIGLLLLVLEIPALATLVFAFPDLLFTQAVVLFLFPGFAGAQFLYLGYRSIQEVGLSSAGFSLRERKGERTVLWADIAELTPSSRGFRYKTATGFAEAVPLVDASVVADVANRLNRVRGDDTGTSRVAPPPESSWQPNPVHRRSRNLFLLLLLVPLAVSLVGVSLAILAPLDPFAFFLIVLPVLPAIFALYPAVWWRQSPSRVAVTADALHVDFGPGRPTPGRVSALRLTAIASLVGREPAEGPSALLGLSSLNVTARTQAGIRLDTGFVSPELGRLLASRLAPDQLTEWQVTASAVPGH